MYFPFLRGKKNELQAISELTSLIVETRKIVPIIEPMNLNPTTRRIIPELNESTIPLIFIINPQVGDLIEEKTDIFNSLLEVIENKHLLTLGYYITENTTIVEIQSIMEIYAEYSFAFIHSTNSGLRNELTKIDERISYHIFIDGRVSTAYQNAFRDKLRVIIKDCFNAKARNVDYVEDEYFSDLFSAYTSEFFGFGDYQIVGANIGGGGPAHAVALHLTYLKEPNGEEIWVRHFISDDTETPANVQGKYFQALHKLVAFLDDYDNTIETIGAIEYRANLEDGNYHGLGFPKKLSMKHHFELMTQLI